MGIATENALKKIQEARGQHLTKLDLSQKFDTSGQKKLKCLPTELFELEQLEVLDLAHNLLQSLPDEMAQLQNLTFLDLENNQLSSLPEWMAQLQNLTHLYLVHNGLSSLPEWMAQLHNLTHLNLSYNQLSSLPEWMAQLYNLAYLNLSYNRLRSLSEWMLQLHNLTTLNLTGNQLSSLPEGMLQLHNLTTLNLTGNQLSSLPEGMAQLHNLTHFYLRNNRLSSLPEWMAQLYNLTSLDLRNNRLSSLPEWMAQLHNLTSLDLSGNQLSNLPEWMAQLQNLTSLDLRHNQLSSLPGWMTQLQNLTSLKLENNPIEIPPPEIIDLDDRGRANLDKIRDYYRQLEAEGVDHLYEAKLLIVGEPGAGKTTLAQKILNPDYELQSEEKTTRGIVVVQWQFPMKNGQTFRVNIWDFGGQEIYHTTHQFFLTKRSLYALVADTRKDDTDFYYWLNVVELLSDNSPMLIVKNEKQDRHREINERRLREQFLNIEKTLATNLKTNRGLPEILDAIKFHISHLPLVGARLPKTWVKVRATLEQDPRNHIGLDEYLEICAQNGFSQRKDKLQLLGYLHDLGVCLHFQEDPLLNKTVILKPEWGTDGVYRVLDNPTVIRKLGRFNKADLDDVWDEPEYADMQGELLRLMINFGLCYQIPGSRNSYIAPQLLTDNQPYYDWDEADNLYLRYGYDFMPKGIATQFIVAMHTWIADQECVWKSGVILDKDETKVEVIEHYDKREIRIRIAGAHKRDLMTVVMHELDRIHDSYHRLRYDKLIPCNCAKCQDSREPHFYRFDILQKFIADRQKSIQCQNSYDMVDVLGLIDDVMDRIEHSERMGRKPVNF